MTETVKETWLERVATYRKSGMTARKWCEENGVNYNTFKNSVTKYTKMLVGEDIHDHSSDPFQWTSIDVTSFGIEKASGITLEVGTVKIHLDDSFDEALLIKTIRTLTRLC